MNKKEKTKTLIIGIVVAVIVIVAIVAVVLFMSKNDNQVKENESQENTGIKAITEKNIVKDEEFGGLKFTNTVLIEEDGYYTLTMDVTNPTDKEINIPDVNITLRDKNNDTVIVLNGNIGEPMQAYETRTITSMTKVDLSSVTSKSIEAVSSESK